MGTSKSSPGPGGDVPLVPPWLDLPPGPVPPILPQGSNPPGIPPIPIPIPAPTQPIPTPLPTQIALPKRFQPARRGLGDYARTGHQSHLKSGLGSYVGRGYRGAGNASSRMGQAATSAARAYATLSGLANGTATTAQLGFDPTSLAGADMDDVIDAIVDSICRNDTTLDDGAGRLAANEALSEVIAQNPGMDPLAMPMEHIHEVYLRTLAYHVFENILHDIGLSLQHGSEGDAVRFNDRCLDIKSFVLESFREKRNGPQGGMTVLTPQNAFAVAREITDTVMEVYEGWIE